MDWLKAIILGYVTSLGGVDLEHGWCYEDGDKGGAALCEFDETTCEGSCGAELTAFESRIEAHNLSVYHGTRGHTRGWTLRFRGDVPLSPTEPYESAAHRLHFDCQNALFYSADPNARALAAPAVGPGQTMITYPRAQMIEPGDIFYDTESHHQVPVQAVVEKTVHLAWAWTGPAAPRGKTKFATGKLVSIAGEYVTASGMCPIYEVGAAKWEREGGRTVPVSVIRTPGWDVVDPFFVFNFDHPGDNLHVNTSLKPTGGTNGVRYIGGCHQSAEIAHGKLLAEGYPPEGFGACFVLLANASRVETQPQMSFAARGYIVTGGHYQRINGGVENTLQLLWAPRGATSLQLDGMMHDQHRDGKGEAPAWLPVIDLGTRTTGAPSMVQIKFPLIAFSRHAPRVFVKARGMPVILDVTASLAHVSQAFDVPEGSQVNGSVRCFGTPDYKCP